MTDWERAKRTGRIECRRGGWGLMLLASPFWGFGAYAIISCLARGTGDGGALRYDGIVVGLFFLAVGVPLGFWRSVLIIDPATSEVVTSWGVVFPFRTKRFRITRDSVVVLSCREVKGEDTYIEYAVDLDIHGDKVRVDASRDVRQMRKTAHRLADFLGLRVKDAVAGETAASVPGQPHLPLRERAACAGERLRRPHAPAGSRIRHQTAGRTTTIDLPRAGLDWSVLLPLLPAMLALWILHVAGEDVPPLQEILTVLGIVVGLPSLVIACVVSNHMFARDHVTVSDEVLEVRRRGVPLTSSWRVRASEVEDVAAGTPEDGSVRSKYYETKGLTVYVDGDSHRFGCVLTSAERDWLVAMIRYAVAGGR